MADTIIWFFIIAGSLASFYFICHGIKKNKIKKEDLSLKYLWKETSFRNSPGKLLIIEGILGLITALILGYAAIFWL